jgi:three-Cys-motif partner protein
MDRGLLEVGPWVRDKLERLHKYLKAYTTIMRKRQWEGYFYIDAFAGSGQIRVRGRTPLSEEQMTLVPSLSEDSEAQEVLNGSPRVALDLEHHLPTTSFWSAIRAGLRRCGRWKRSTRAKGRFS